MLGIGVAIAIPKILPVLGQGSEYLDEVRWVDARWVAPPAREVAVSASGYVKVLLKATPRGYRDKRRVETST